MQQKINAIFTKRFNDSLSSCNRAQAVLWEVNVPRSRTQHGAPSGD